MAITQHINNSDYYEQPIKVDCYIIKGNMLWNSNPSRQKLLNCFTIPLVTDTDNKYNGVAKYQQNNNLKIILYNNELTGSLPVLSSRNLSPFIIGSMKKILPS